MPFQVSIVVIDTQEKTGHQIETIIPLEAYGNLGFAMRYARAVQQLVEASKQHEFTRRP